ncbi:MAG: hypothetical protein E7634_03840 [Ruminococcaceae bacterium]|nr:hypothetical protein [Oscillospiraceae bacterium]
MKSKNQKTPQNSSVRGMIIKKGESYYTDLYKLLDALDSIPLNYKWLVSYPECSAFTKETQALFEKEYCIISGDELTEIAKDTHQFIWGTFSAFAPDTPDEEILKYPLPKNDMYPGFWKLPLTVQHPLAQIEIVAFDSSLTLVLTRDIDFPEKFQQVYPLAQDLAEHNAKL